MLHSTVVLDVAEIQKGRVESIGCRDTLRHSFIVLVKSTSPLQKNGYENGYENCIYSMNNINMSNEDNKHDTKYINKNDTDNHDARKLHE